MRIVLLLALIGCKRGADADVARIETTGAQLVDGVGGTATLVAVAYDADGNVLPNVDVTWSSDTPAVVTIDGDAATGVAIGSGTVRASVGDVTSEPVFVWVAEVVEGAVLVSDEQIVSSTVPAAPDVGATYTAVLDGVDVTDGALVVSTQGKAVAGRVVSTTPGADGVEVGLELVALTDLFEDLAVDVHDSADVEVAADPLVEFALGGFECEAEGDRPTWPEPQLVGTLTDTLTVARDLTVSLLSRRVEHALLRLTGMARVDVAGEVPFPLDTSVSVECSRTLGTARLPFPGPLGLLFQTKVPLGVGFEAGGSFEGTSVTYYATGAVRTEVDLGFEYTQGTGLQRYSAYTPAHELQVSWSTPILDEGATIKAELYAYASAGLKVGPAIVDDDDANLDLAELKAGVKGEYELTGVAEQLGDPDKKGTYQVTLHGELGAGDDFARLLRLVGIDAQPVNIDPPPDSVLWKSPEGTSTVTPSGALVANEPVTLAANLDPTTVYAGDDYNIDALLILREDPEDGWEEVARLPAAKDQTQFQQDWTPTAADVSAGAARFAFLVETPTMPGAPIEIAPDSIRNVGVGPMTVTATLGSLRRCQSGYTMWVNDYVSSGDDVPLPASSDAASGTECPQMTAWQRVSLIDPDSVAVDVGQWADSNEFSTGSCIEHATLSQTDLELSFAKAGTLTIMVDASSWHNSVSAETMGAYRTWPADAPANSVVVPDDSITIVRIDTPRTQVVSGGFSLRGDPGDPESCGTLYGGTGRVMRLDFVAD